ncbi:pyridoxamine 5'-phosphate oxidase family protein [Adlercreutzia sp. R7]|uniref:Pyridoxamine 5'-phosphate oxidase family protein n=1 Tax=Adlercreutzia wanghongyangiae TaxID=3111451 RepID=A0ABU6IIU0_9ACTN|nr:pyridoxamine 5'-phosphate oxidase family protein [Adlercreutzia sp. R7]
MIPKMRRHKQQLPADECEAILRAATYGVLGTGGTNDIPYAVPLSFAYLSTSDKAAEAPAGRIYLHCATTGHKLDALAENPRVCLTVVAQSEPVPEKLTDRFRSVMAFGSARIVEDEDEKCLGLVALGDKYAPGMPDVVNEEIASTMHRTCVIAIDVQHITGKEGLELLRERAN